MVALAVLLIAVLRPADVALVRSLLGVAVLAVAAGALLLLAALVSSTRWGVRWATASVGVVMIGTAVVGTMVIGSVVGFRADRPIQQLPVQGTDLTVAVVQGDSDVEVPAVVLWGRLGPLPREQTVLLPPGPCDVTVSSPSSRQIEVRIAYSGSSDCMVEGVAEVVRYEVGDDGWTVRQVPT